MNNYFENFTNNVQIAVSILSIFALIGFYGLCAIERRVLIMSTLKLFFKIDGQRKYRKSSLSVPAGILSFDALKHCRDFVRQHAIDNDIDPETISARFEADNGDLFVGVSSEKERALILKKTKAAPVEHVTHETKRVTPRDFMAFFRSDESLYPLGDDETLNMLSVEDRVEIFKTILLGAEDLTPDLINDISREYDAGVKAITLSDIPYISDVDAPLTKLAGELLRRQHSTHELHVMIEKLTDYAVELESFVKTLQ